MGSFYSPKGPRSHLIFIWKALVAFCPRVHRTVRCTSNSAQSAIPYNRPRRPLSQPLGPLVVEHIGLSGGAFRPLAQQTWPPCGHRWMRPLVRGRVACRLAHRTVWWILASMPGSFSESVLYGHRPGRFDQMTSQAPDYPLHTRLSQSWSFWAKLLSSFLDRFEKFPSTWINIVSN
jgi:hypothetical protein